MDIVYSSLMFHFSTHFGIVWRHKSKKSLKYSFWNYDSTELGFARSSLTTPDLSFKCQWLVILEVDWFSVSYYRKKSSVPRGLLASKVYSVQKYESLFKLLVSLMYARIAVSHVASTRLTLLIESNGSI